MQHVRRMRKSDEAGVTGIEYALLLGVLGLVVAIIMGPLTNALSSAFERKIDVPGPEICVNGVCSLNQGPFDLAYDANGATSGATPAAGAYDFGTTITVTGNTGGLAKTNFVFAGWNSRADGSGTPYAAGQTFSMPAADLTLFAVWAGKYALGYSGNGNTAGTAPTDSKSPYDTGSLVNVKGPGTLAKRCGTFAGWNTKADGSGAWYAANAKLLMPASPVTLFAQWVTQPEVSLTYDGNGNTSGHAPTDSASPYCSGTSATVLANSGGLARTGYTFTGWNTEAAGTGLARAAGQTLSMTSNTTLYAQWVSSTPASCTVTYHANGGTGTIAPITDPCGSTLTLSTGTGLTRSGFTFVGWNTSSIGTGTAYVPGSSVVVNANLDLYAQWSATPVLTLTYVGNGNTGGSAPVDANSPYAAGASVTVSGSGSLVRLGYAFSGWTTAADGSGTSYAAGSTFTIAASTTLYAKWTATCPVVQVSDTFAKVNSGSASGSRDFAADLPAGSVITAITKVVTSPAGAGTFAFSGSTTTWTYPNGQKAASATVAYGYAGLTCSATWSVATH